MVADESVPSACVSALMLERAAEIQLLAEGQPGGRFHRTPEWEAVAKQAIRFPERQRITFEYYVRTL